MFHGRLQILPCSPTNPIAITQWLNDQVKVGLMFKRSLFGRIVFFRKSENEDIKFILQTSTSKASSVVYAGILSHHYFVYKTTNPTTKSEIKVPKLIWVSAVMLVLFVFALFRLPSSEFPIEHKLSWITVSVAFFTLYFLLDTITHLPCIFSMWRNGKYSQWGKVFNGTMLSILAVAISFYLVHEFYTPDGTYIQPVLRLDSERAYIAEEYVPLGQRTEYTEHLAHGDSLRIADYRFVSSGFAEYFVARYCDEIKAKEITEIGSDVCNELVQLFNYEADHSLRIFSNRECSMLLIKNESRVVRFAVYGDISAYDIYHWLQTTDLRAAGQVTE